MSCIKNNYKFFSNTECKYFPCHVGICEDEFNCLFCFCPLYMLGSKCGGNFTFTKEGVKDCSQCTIPHRGVEAYDIIVKKIEENIVK